MIYYKTNSYYNVYFNHISINKIFKFKDSDDLFYCSVRFTGTKKKDLREAKRVLREWDVKEDIF